MPLFRYLHNKQDNNAQHLDWGYISVSCEYATVRYSDVEVVNFFFSHSMHSTNFVKNDDTISYMIRINEYLSREAIPLSTGLVQAQSRLAMISGANSKGI